MTRSWGRIIAVGTDGTSNGRTAASVSYNRFCVKQTFIYRAISVVERLQRIFITAVRFAVLVDALVGGVNGVIPGKRSRLSTAFIRFGDAMLILPEMEARKQVR